LDRKQRFEDEAVEDNNQDDEDDYDNADDDADGENESHEHHDACDEDGSVEYSDDEDEDNDADSSVGDAVTEACVALRNRSNFKVFNVQSAVLFFYDFNLLHRHLKMLVLYALIFVSYCVIY
jgi:hypothetical protein